MKRIKFIISYILIVSLLVTMAGCGISSSTVKKEKTFNLKDGKNYTIMIYMVGSNLESENAAASRDIMEMADSGIDFEHNNVIIYAGGSTIWHLDNMMSTRNNLVQLTAKNGQPVLKQLTDSEELSSYSAVNMGKDTTLTQFVDYCYDNYKANNYSLILWDHGSGPIGGFGKDDLFEGDSLYKIEMGEALKNTKFCQKEKFGFVGFDACLMSSVEFARTLSDYADYMVASQEVEPGYGWDYKFMNMFNKTDNPADIGKEVLKTYESFYKTKGVELNNPDLTLSLLDLNKTKDIVAKMDALFEQMSVDISEDTFTEFAQSRDNTKAFALSSTGRGNSLDVVDLGDFMENVPEKYSETASEVNSLLNSMVVSKYSNIPQSSGVSFYYPYDNQQNFEKMGKYLYGIDGCQNYTNFIEYFTKFWGNATSASEDVFADSTWDRVDTKENKMKFHFSDKELKGIKKISYTIFRSHNYKKDQWEPMYENVEVNADSNGDVLISYSPEVFYVKGANDISVPWRLTQVNKSKDETVWMLKNTELQDYLDYNGIDNFDKDQPVNITLSEKKDGSIEIKDMLKVTSDNSLGKENVDISKYSSMQYIADKLIVKKTKDGKTKPYTQWIRNGQVHYYDSVAEIEQTNSKNNPFSVEKKPLVNDTRDINDYAIQLVVEDYNGNQRGSKLKSLNKKTIYSKETEKIDGVEYTFRKYDNKSVLIGIKTDKKEVNIPSSLGGRKVTEIINDIQDAKHEYVRKVTIPKGVTIIGEDAFGGWSKLENVSIPNTVKRIEKNAFEGCGYLRELNLPESLEYLGNAVLKDTNVRKITIPKNLKQISGGAFSNVVEEIAVDGNNKYYAIVEGALFTKDKKMLVYYPHKPIEYNNKTQVKTIDLKVPNGCEKIGSQAIGCEQISKIEFPNTLKEIGPGAFSSCGFIKELNFPDSLNSIGSGAFLDAIGGEVQIHIGKNIDYVGPAAFKGNYISKFTVSKDNKNYSELEGNVTNKSKDTLIFSKTKNGKEFKVPNGIVALSSSSLDGVFKKYTDKDAANAIVIPDSVVSIERFLDDWGCKKWTIGKGVRYWGDIDFNISLEGKAHIWSDTTYIISKDNPYYYVDGKYIKKKKHKETDKMSPKAVVKKYKK